jgi:hypothetical protein
MFEDLLETRYPFENAREFLAGNYWSQLEALHLVLGWLFLLVVTWVVMRKTRFPIVFRCASLYFALALFTNFAYDIGGLKVNEFFGVFTIGIVMVSAPRLHKPMVLSPVVRGLLIVFGISVAHNAFVTVIYPDLNPDSGTLAVRTAVTVKILILAVNLFIVTKTLRAGMGVNFLVKLLVVVGTFGLLMYLLQGILLVAGVIPFGTFLDAGYVGVPAFGSISIERGHFGKFMAPIFPFFLFALLTYRWRWPFFLYIILTACNLSASSLVFFVTSLGVAGWMFRDRMTLRNQVIVGATILAPIFMIVTAFPEVFAAVADKIVRIAFQGDERSGGGRSFGVFYEYIANYPLGIGYSGSTLRTPSGLPEINAAHFAFVSQYSLLAAPLFVLFIYLVHRTLSVARQSSEWALLLRTLSIGIVVSVLIFLTDILWFVPTIWLSYEMIWALARKNSTKHHATPHPQQRKLIVRADSVG